MLTMLHFTDLHRGGRGEAEHWRVVCDALDDDLDLFCDKFGVPNLILFTGDLANRGDPNEYREIEEELIAFLDDKLGVQVPVFTVPGNHDLQRPSNPDAWRWMWNDDPDAVSIRAHVLENEPERIRELFAAYTAFSERLHARMPGLKAGLLPGDARWSFVLDGLRVGVVGLNSAWRQVDSRDYLGRVCIHHHQMDALFDDVRAAAFRKSHHLVLALQHHPVTWMDPTSGWHRHVGSMADATLFGHMHENDATVGRRNRNKATVLVQSKSLFGLEKYGTKDENRAFGYRWIAAERTEGARLSVRTWGRMMQTREDGQWFFRRDVAEEVREDEPIGLMDEPLRVLRRPRPALDLRALPELPSEVREFVLNAFVPECLDGLMGELDCPRSLAGARPGPERTRRFLRWLQSQPLAQRQGVDLALRDQAPKYVDEGLARFDAGEA